MNLIKKNKTFLLINNKKQNLILPPSLNELIPENPLAHVMDAIIERLNTLGERNSYSKTNEKATFMRMKEDAMLNGQLKPSSER